MTAVFEVQAASQPADHFMINLSAFFNIGHPEATCRWLGEDRTVLFPAGWSILKKSAAKIHKRRS
jgi:hypothetical protein